MSITAQQTSVLTTLGLANAPVAMAFVETPPTGLAQVDRAQPAGCAYWREASKGRAFYTAADDHTGCPVGAFTHGVALSENQTRELQSLVGTMIELKYLKSEEVSQIPHRADALRFAAYAPLGHSGFEPDLVIFRGNARQIMLLSEAARGAGVFDAAAVMGRPACAMVPQTLKAGSGIASLGCIGNRVYTGLGDDELYITIPGGAVARVLEQLETVLTANAALEQFHRGQKRPVNLPPSLEGEIGPVAGTGPFVRRRDRGGS